jgi:hypothetical protein
MFSRSAQLYDAIYRAFKDYAAEATALATLVRAAHPSARSILDVGLRDPRARAASSQHAWV